MLMKTLFRRRRSLLAGSALAVMLTLGLVAVAPRFSSPASAQTGPSCADPVTSALDGVLRPCLPRRRPMARCWWLVRVTTPVARCTCSPRTSSTR